MDLVFQYIGMISAFSFVVVAGGDFIVRSLDIIVSKTSSTKDDAVVAKVDFWWTAIKEVYEEFRSFIDRFSAYSRPRK
jgi:hypothetical protein